MKLAVLAVACTAVMPVFAKDTILFNRIGPSQISLSVANADGSGEHLLFPTSGFDYNASFSPDGKWIVFTSERDGSADVYRVHPDGSGIERLTNDPSCDDQGALSPDGTQLAFVSTRGSGTADIWVLDLKSKRVRNLTSTGANPGYANRLRGNFRPSWSLDGKWIAFSSDRGAEFKPHSRGWEHVQAASIYIAHPDGTELRRVTDGAKFAGSPKWSADGKRLVFYEMEVGDTFFVRLNSTGQPSPVTTQIVTMDIATGARIAVTSGAGVKIAPQFLSEDRVAYLMKAAPKDVHIGLAYTSGGQGAEGVMRNPSWSPDGKQVVYQQVNFAIRGQNTPFYAKSPEFDLRFTDIMPALSKDRKLALTDFRGALVDPRASISIMDADGSNVQRVYVGDDGAAMAPAWSPDGKWIAFGFGAFFGARATQPARVMMVKADGSEKKELTKGPLNSGFPSFSPDGKRLVFRVWANNERGLRIMNLEDLSVTNLTTESDNFPQWSPAGDRIMFTRAFDGDFDIFSIRPDGKDLKRLTDAAGNDAHGTFSPDGKFIMFSTSRLGFKDEAPLYEHSPQPYGEMFIMNADGSDQRPLTDNNWEDASAALVPALVQTSKR